MTSGGFGMESRDKNEANIDALYEYFFGKR